MDSLNQTAIMEVEDYEFNSFLFWLGLFGLYIVFGIFLSFTMPIVIIVNYSNTILGFFELHYEQNWFQYRPFNTKIKSSKV